MPGLLQGLNTALRGILAKQAALQTVAHNVANANTEGYSKQTGPLQATQPVNVAGLSQRMGPGVIGTGVTATPNKRNRDSFLDLQFRSAAQQLGQYEELRNSLRQIEAILGEPSDSSITTVLQDMFDAMQGVSGMPEDASGRTAMIASAETLAFKISTSYEQIYKVQTDLNNRIIAATVDINDKATQIASLNAQIGRSSGTNTPANDLMDRRDLLLDQLSKLVSIHVTAHANNETDVRIEGMLIVARDKSYSLTTATNAVSGFDDIVYSPFSQVITPSNGELSGMVNARDVKIGSVAAGTGLMNRLNTFASNLLSETNALHRGGYGLEPTGDDNITDVTNVLGNTGQYWITSNGAGTLTATFQPTGGAVSTAVTGTIATDGINSTLIPGITLTGASAFTGVTTVITVSDGLVVSAGGDVAVATNINGTFSMLTNVAAGTVDISFTPIGGAALPTVTKTFTAGAANDDLITGLSITYDAAVDLTEGGTDVITTGNNFFTGITQLTGIAARDIAVDGSFDTSVGHLAASSEFREEGNGSAALNMSNLGTTIVTALGTTSFNEYHRSTISSLGADTRQNAAGADNHDDLITLVKSTRQATSGVSIDEETADLLRFEMGFQGSARVLTTIDELLELIVNRLGTSGR